MCQAEHMIMQHDTARQMDMNCLGTYVSLIRQGLSEVFASKTSTSQRTFFFTQQSVSARYTHFEFFFLINSQRLLTGH